MDDESHSVGSSGAIDNATRERLRQTIEKIERLEIEKKEIAEQIKDVYAEAKATGFEPKIMRQIVRLRGMDSELLNEQDELLTTYRTALGLV